MVMTSSRNEASYATNLTHETSGELFISSDLSVNKDVSFLVIQDHLDFSSGQGVLKTVSMG
jgi:hypothetical protein